MKIQEIIRGLIPAEARAYFAVAKSMKAQGSLEYIMMVAAASVVIVIALAMVVKLKGSVGGNVTINGTSTSVTGAISKELGDLSSNNIIT